jgi:hypothetical protein
VKAIIEDTTVEEKVEEEAVVLPLLPAIPGRESVNPRPPLSALLNIVLNASPVMRRSVRLLPNLVNLALLLLLRSVLIAILPVICALLLLFLMFTGCISDLRLRRTSFLDTSLENCWLACNVLLLVLVESFGMTLSTTLQFGKLDLLIVAIVEIREKIASVF